MVSIPDLRTLVIDVSETGLPYLTEEDVEGVHIDHYNNNELPVATLSSRLLGFEVRGIRKVTSGSRLAELQVLFGRSYLDYVSTPNRSESP